MNKDRGMIKWAPFNSVVNSKELTKEILKERERIILPTLSEDNYYQIEQMIINAYFTKSTVTIVYFENGYLYNCTPLFQLDMYLTSFSHGGVIVNEYGYVVGMSTFKDPDESNLPHAIYAAELVHFANRILNKEIAKRGDLGINISALEDISVENQEMLGYEDYKRGTIITSTTGRASSAGLSINQLILEVNGQKMNDTVELIRAIYKYNSGSIVRIKILKPNGQTKTCKVKL